MQTVELRRRACVSVLLCLGLLGACDEIIGPETGTGGSSGGTGGTAGTPTTGDDLGVGDGSDVVTIGDSWMANTLGTGNAIEGALDRLGTDYRHYGQQGARLLRDGFLLRVIPAIPKQFDEALDDGADIKTVIMTGGGNDVLLESDLVEDCQVDGPDCEERLLEIKEGLEGLWADMAAAGVRDVLYIGYSSDAGTAGSQATNVFENGVADSCAEAPLRCHVIDSTSLVLGEFQDSVHPNQAANNRMAIAIVDKLAEVGARR